MIIVKRKPIRYKNDEKFYVPVYQEDFDKEGELLRTPTFRYSMSEATHDEQMAWAMGADYVLELSGHFDATTKPLIIKDPEEDK